jgi:hypothetical protein
MRTLRIVLPFVVIALMTGGALAKGAMPEDSLKGRIIVSDKPLPTSWKSVPSYVSQLRQLDKSVFWYDKTSGKVTLQYAAFFAQPLPDAQVDLVMVDVTSGAHLQKFSTENFARTGERVLFNTVELSKEDIEPNRKYLLMVQSHRRIIASVTFILRGQGPNFSGKVNFSDEETKDAKKE